VEAVEITREHCCGNLRIYCGCGLCIQKPKFVASGTASRIDHYDDSGTHSLAAGYNNIGIRDYVTDHSAATNPISDWASLKWNLSLLSLWGHSFTRTGVALALGWQHCLHRPFSDMSFVNVVARKFQTQSRPAKWSASGKA
jgi:hypothetical protein